MSDSPPPKPKPGSLRDRIAAFEQKPASSPAPPVPRPKPGGLSQWKPRAPSPPHSPQPVNRNDHSMSATDAKESITKGGSLKERMAALQGLGAFGGGPATSPPPKPSEKPKWKPPPQVTVAPPVTGDDGEDVSTSGVADTSSIPAVSPLKTPDEEIMAVLSKSPPRVNEEASVIVSDVPGEREEEADPDEEERQRRAAIAARMARLGGTRVGMGPPIFGLKPEVKPKPVALAGEKAKEELPIADIPVGEPVLKTESNADHGQVETETADNAASSPTVVVSPQLQSASPEYISQQASPATSPNIPPRAMPLLQGPRRAAPPRKKVMPKSTLSTETEVAPESLGDTSGVTSEGLPLPIPMLSHVETEVVAADPIADTSPSEPASGRPTEEPLDGPAPIVHIPEEKSEPSPPTRLPSDPSDLRPGSPEESQVDSRTERDFPLPDVPTELDVPSELQVPREESELEEATAYEPNKDGVAVEDETTRGQHMAERVSKMGEFNPSGGQPDTSPLDEPTTLHAERKLSVDTLPTGTGGSTLENQSPQLGASLASYSVSSQGGSANAVNDEDGGDNESDPHAQALLQHAVEHELLKTPEGGIDYDGEDARVAHEVENVAEPGQPPEDRYDEAATAEATSSPPSPIHSRSATGEPAAAQVGVEGEPSVEDDSDSEMAPPRVTRPLPPAPAPPAPGVSTESAIAHTRAPIVPAVLKRASVPPPTRAVPAPDNPPLLAPGSSPQRTPSVKRASVPPPSREIPVPFQESPDAASSWRPSPTQRTSISTRFVPSPSVPHPESLIPPPPPPPIFGGIDHGRVLTRGPDVIPQVQDDPISLPPALTPKPSIPPLTPEGRKSVESRRSTDSRHSREERRSSGSGHYGIPAVPVPGPLKKRAPTSLVPEQGVLHEEIGDPTDPQPHTPSKPPVPHTPPPTSAEPLSSVLPTSAASLQSVNETEDDDGLERRKTIAERMAKLGGIKFGAPPPIPRAQPSTSAVPTEELSTDRGVQSSGQSVPEEPGEPSEEAEAEDEQARRQRIAAKLAGMGGMRIGMLPMQPGMVVGSPPPPPPVSTRREEEATPREPPRTIPPPPEAVALQSESDYEYEHPSSSDDGVHVEAEESELEEVYHEDLEDEYGVQEVEDEDEEPLPPPPPPPRSTRPPIPSARPPPVPPAGRRPSTEQVPSTPPPRTGSVDTLTSIPRPPVRQATSDFVMVEPEDAQLVPARRGPPPRSAPPAPELELASTGQWELPSIPSGSLDFGDSGATSDLSASRWSEDSTSYPSPAPRSSAPPPAPPPTAVPPRLSVEQPRAHTGVPARMTVDELRAVWGRVGVRVAEAAGALLERSKHKFVGNGSYEGFVAEALAGVPNALASYGPGEYGFLVYAQTGAQVHTRLADIMPGDVVVLEGARFKGHKGLHTYSMSAGESAPCMGVVSEFDPKKLKLKALQANQRVGQAIVESVSYRLEDLKSGTIKVYRVLEA